MQATRFIARRLGFRGRMVTLSVAVSFFVIGVAVAVSSGFRREIRGGITSVVGDIRLSAQVQQFTLESPAFPLTSTFRRALSGLPGVKEVSPAILRAGIVQAGTDIEGVMVKGVETDDTTALGVRIPESLASSLRIGVGDEMLTWFVSYGGGEVEDARIAARKFVVTEVFPLPVRVQEVTTVYASLPDMRRLCRYEDDEVNLVELRLDPSHLDAKGYSAAKAAAEDLVYGPDGVEGVVVQSAPDAFPALFDWLDLLDFNVRVVLILMILVSGFNMVSGLLILMFRSISTIGTLKSLGMTDVALVGVFFRVSLRKVLAGLLWGNLAAILFCVVQHVTHFIKLNPVNYYVDYVPVSLNLPYLLTAEAVAVAALLVLVSLPVLFVTRVDPADTVRMN